jgi:predicted DCC family thiol-disulfide oxidoreductase YuxK
MQPTILYDGTCRFCTAQASRLQRLSRGRVAIESTYAPGVRARYPELPSEGAVGEIKLADADGRMLGGAAAIARALEIGGGPLGWLARAYHLPLVGPVADRVYVQIAKRRYRISGRCQDGSCAVDATHAPLPDRRARS